MEKLILVSVGVGLGWWLKSRNDERNELRRENEILRNKMKEKGE